MNNNDISSNNSCYGWVVAFLIFAFCIYVLALMHHNQPPLNAKSEKIEYDPAANFAYDSLSRPIPQAYRFDPIDQREP